MILILILKIITNILNEINKTDDKYIFVLIENIWSILPYQIKNLTYQNIEKIKSKCKAFEMPTKCKILYDIFGIL